MRHLYPPFVFFRCRAMCKPGIKIRNRGVIADAPETFRDKFPDELWYVYVYKKPADYELSSYSATAGYINAGEKVLILTRWSYPTSPSGLFGGERIDLLKIRGIDENGKQVTGWVMSQLVTITG